MSNETKREVFEDTLDAYDDSRPYPHPGYDSPAKLLDRYDAALPDDLPVIPKAVGEWLTWCKERDHSLKDALDGETRVSEDTFARAWLLGVWRVEETGEIVKLEAEK
ncbi:MAG: hypothetical protein ABF912_10290 [Lacticaseibacillus paracasei]